MSTSLSTPSLGSSYTNARWRLTRYGKLYPGLLSKVTRGRRIGQKSVYGTVIELLYRNRRDSRFVLKSMNFPERSRAKRRRIFDTEIRVGTMRNIQRVGTRVLAWRYTPKGGEYIMDDARFGIPGARLESLEDIIQKGKLSQSLIRRVLQKVHEFHRVVGGEHGDLHGDNIMVVKKGDKTSIKIIDYGAVRSYHELRRIGRPVNTHGGMNVFSLGSGQNYIRNRNWLKKVLYE